MNPKYTNDHTKILAPPPLIFFGCLLASWLLHHLLPLPVMGAAAALAAGIAALCAAGFLIVWAAIVMQTCGTNIRPDRPALKIVTAGPYKFTRNPMYVSLCLLQLGFGLVLDGWIPLLSTAILALILNYGVILREEQYLEAKFGGQYTAFKKSVRRWL